ncbi:hypothetical protein [Streptomyces ficellus]|nr:hypothetical protein [Streptomyces ficellus]
MPIDPFSALNALIRAEATRSPEPDRAPASGTDQEPAARPPEDDEK